MRCFIEIDTPESIKRYLLETITGLKKACENAGYDFNIVKKENIHVTLAFLGETGERDIGRIVKKASEIAEKYEGFECRISKIEAVPARFPRMIWASLDRIDALRNMYAELRQALKLEDEGREFAPHITLARLKSRGAVNPRRITAAVRAINTAEMKFQVRELKIMQSILKKEGPEYVLIKSIPLGKNINP